MLEKYLQKLTLINLEYNAWNGFMFEILSIEYQGKKRGFQKSLFAIYFVKDFLIIDLLFITFEIK